MEEEAPLVTFHLASDLHLEFGEKFEVPKPESPGKHICILAGDIGHPTKPHYKEFLVKTRKKFDEVVVILGNHEYFSKNKRKLHANIQEVIATAKAVAENTGCILLDRDVYTLPDEKISILGCTLWSHIKPEEYYTAKQGDSDFRNVYLGGGDYLTPPLYDEWHQRDLEWLTREITERPDENLVIVTHHCPTMRVIDPIYHQSPLNMCYVTDLEYLFKDSVKIWTCGHSHRRGSCLVNERWCALNPRGYPSENREFQPLSFSFFKGGELKLIIR